MEPLNKLITEDRLIIGIPILIIIITGIYFLLKPIQYKNQRPLSPEYSSRFEGSTPEEVQKKLVDSEEKFIGSIDYKYTNPEKTEANIHMFNDYTGDDSVMAYDYIYTILKKDDVWRIINAKNRWKCRSIFFESWTTSPCI